MAEGVLNARKLYGEILAQGYPGKESKVREFVHDRRPEQEPSGSIRFETAPGEQGQVDWGTSVSSPIRDAPVGSTLSS